MYRRTSNLEVVGYSDSDFASCVDSCKSTSGYIFILAGGAISWRSVKQTLIATSTNPLTKGMPSLKFKDHVVKWDLVLLCSFYCKTLIMMFSHTHVHLYLILRKFNFIGPRMNIGFIH